MMRRPISPPGCCSCGQPAWTMLVAADLTSANLFARRAKKQGRPPGDYLGRFAKASHLAATHAGGLLEPLYVLHAARLKLLDAQLPASTAGGAAADVGGSADVLDAVARYRFQPPGGSASQPGSRDGSPQGGR